MEHIEIVSNMELRDPEETNNGFICYHNSFCTIFVRNCPSVHICLMKKTRYVLKGVVYHYTTTTTIWLADEMSFLSVMLTIKVPSAVTLGRYCTISLRTLNPLMELSTSIVGKR